MFANNRMLEGSPLVYYPRNSPQFTYLDRFHPFPNMSDDLGIPDSPGSIQSDSDNSMSSVDISTQTKPNKISNQVKCNWKSCGLHFDSLKQLAVHVSKVHSASGPGGLFYCGWDGCSRNNRGFNAKYKMLVHVRTHTNEKPHQCSQCDKSFSRAENLKIHSRSHSGEKPYVCPIPGCNKAYSNSSDRFKHSRTHQVEKPYQCKVPGCPKKYTDPSSLRKHVKTYKHFVNENSQESKYPVGNSITVLEEKPPKGLPQDKCIKDCTSKDKNCCCPHNCCVSNSLSKAAELLRLGALINFPRVEMKSMSFDEIFEPFIPERHLFRPFDIKDDIDLPLDLSISPKQI